MGCRRLILGLGLLLASLPVQAANDSPEPFRVTGYAIHAEMERAELCLNFSTPLDIQDRDAIAASMQLERNGSRVQIAPHDLSLTPSDLCVQQLEHRRNYRLTLKGLRDAKGAVLKAYSVTILVPDRKPSLTFATARDTSGMPRLTRTEKGGVDFAALADVDAINVATAKLKLFHIGDSKNFAAAWQQYAQATLAPSESLYFAKHNGAQVWEGVIAFGKMPDKEQSLAVTLPEDDRLKPGLYFLSAMPEDETETNPALLAGQWFVVSDVRLTAGRYPGGIYVFASNAAASQPMANVAIQILTRDGKVLAEGKSGADGVTALTLEAEKLATAALVVGTMPAGDVALLPITAQGKTMMPINAPDATMTTDRTLYQPGSTANVVLWAHDAEGHGQRIAKSSLKLVRPDQNFYNEQPVPADKDGPLFFSVALPMAGQAGDWLLLWQQSDGQVLARTNVRVTSDLSVIKPEIIADHAALDNEGAFALTIKAKDGQGKPVTYRSGSIVGEAVRPEFTAWPDYTFGTIPGMVTTKALGRFITGGDGMAHMNLRWPMADGTHAVRLTASLDQAPDTVTLNLPAQAEDGWIGIKPLSDRAMFTENSLATFNVLALDASGKRRARGDLTFQVYEEGRNFKWYQDSGHWDYQPLPQHRRVGGGRLNIAASGDNRIVWPVTAGHYVLEIADESGMVLAQYGFDAGGMALAMGPDANDRLTMNLPRSLDVGKENAVTLNLAQPAMIAAVVGDVKDRQVVHRFMPAGANILKITPAPTWGRTTALWVAADFADGKSAYASSVATVRDAQRELMVDVTSPTEVVAGQALALPINVQKGNGSQVYAAAVATPVPDEGDSHLASVTQTPVKVDEKGHAVMQLALPEFSGKLKVVLFAWNETQMAQQSLTIKVKSRFEISANVPEILNLGDVVSVALAMENGVAPDGAYTYEISATDGIKLDGNLKGGFTLKHGQSRAVRVMMNAKEALQGALKLELNGPDHFHVSRVWPIVVRGETTLLPNMTTTKMVPQQTLALPLKETKAAEKKKGDEPAAVLISPMPLLDAPRALASVLAAEPFTTKAVAEWLAVTKRWMPHSITLGLAQEDSLRMMRKMRFDQLRQRQNYDGGFAALPGGGPSEVLSTIAALQALREEMPLEAAQAAIWLRRYTDNTWFDESEREVRAAAFMALTYSDQVDASALRYFGDSSRDKNVGPLAAAKLALALARNHDDAMARTWLERARAAIPDMIKTHSVDLWPTLALLAENSLVPLKELVTTIEGIGDFDVEPTLTAAAARLHVVDAMAQRNGVWHLGINGPIHNLMGVYSASLREKAAAQALRTPANENLYVVQTETGGDKETMPKGAAALTIQRQLYHLDGSPADEPGKLEQGQVYMLVLHGQGKAPDGDLVIANSLGGGIEPLAFGNADTDAFAGTWPWLPPLTVWRGVAANASMLGFAVPATEDWRVVALIKPKRSGSFTLPPVTVQDMPGHRIKAASSALPIQVE